MTDQVALWQCYNCKHLVASHGERPERCSRCYGVVISYVVSFEVSSSDMPMLPKWVRVNE